MHSQSTRRTPNRCKMGWREVSGVDHDQPPLAQDDEAQERLFQFLPIIWHRDATLVAVAAISAHILTRLHFGWAWYILLLACCHSHYSTSMRHFRARAGDDILRQHVKRHLAHGPEIESAEWINKLLDRLWLVYEPDCSRKIGALVDRVLAQHCPSSLDALHLSKFALGTKAPRIDTLETRAHPGHGAVLLELGFSFAPYDTSEMTGRQKLHLVKPSVILNARSGKHPERSFFLDDICFRGRVELLIKFAPTTLELTTSAADLSFVEKPALDYTLKPVHAEIFESLDTVNTWESDAQDQLEPVVGREPNVAAPAYILD
ncbi:hypothetical protein C2E23DRAFT_859364 [Lenzites betulinus]|nr:hypothetical protein C2E23DRAFT_859364 [Lenzites betulinus]